MPNIVYVLANPAMPGFVKIGITNKNDVRERMRELYTTGVPLPFECVIARQLEDREAADVERALHTAFGPSRVSLSREFFQIDQQQAEAVLKVMPGFDVTPTVAALQQEDSEASEQYKRRQTRVSEAEFLELVNESGRQIYERVLALGKQAGLTVNWNRSSFSLYAVSNGTRLGVGCGYISSAYSQRFYVYLSSVPERDVDPLRERAREIGFEPSGSSGDLSCRTDTKLEEDQLDALIGWLEDVVRRIKREVGNGAYPAAVSPASPE